MECKARRARFEDKFGEGLEVKEGASDELVKAVIQIWRFASHHRQGKAETPLVADNAIGVVITPDNWMEFAERQKANIVARALKATSDDETTVAIDGVSVVFRFVEEIEETLRENEDAVAFEAFGARPALIGAATCSMSPTKYVAGSGFPRAILSPPTLERR